MHIQAARIRFAEFGEAETIAKLSRDTIEVGLPWRWQPAEIERFIRSNRHNVIVAHDSAHLVGFAVMGYGDDDAYLALLAVLPSHRRQGRVASPQRVAVHWARAHQSSDGDAPVVAAPGRRFSRACGRKAAKAAVEGAKPGWENAE